MSIKGKVIVGAYQFAGSADISANLKRIKAGIKKAASKKVDILAFHECALTGYAGVELKTLEEIDKVILKSAEKEITHLAAKHKINVIFGTTTFKSENAFNSLVYIDKSGERKSTYSKRAMYGSDDKFYSCGKPGGIVKHNKLTVGLRICFEFRYPEYFRELLKKNVDLAVCSFSMVGKNNKKYQTAKAHLISRAAENGIYVMSANSLNGIQNCPTCIIDPDGNILADAGVEKEKLITAEISEPGKNPVRERIV
ncbi:MAG: carbon-nitrogen hydrolase family protein, partial [Planctomycetota bacterium]